MAKPRVLLVEDDRELAGMLGELLADEGYETEAAHDGQRGLHLGLTGRYDVLVIDRRLPVLDGLELLRRLRARAVTTRVLVLSALGEVADRVAGLDAGADDYLVKPFEAEELLARLRALGRRDLEGAECLPLGTAALDLQRHEVVLPRGERITLSGREFELLRTLAQRPKAIHPRAALRTRVFADSTGESIVDTYVYYLRRKLGRDVVRTVHGLGYQIGAV
ncbi:DNA-binding response regulator, OmpR family, contains REC and winged-helix (wHTH) domain [Amycolatopsis tolypomycina]|uniref:DNA-binding response regulator, OmpR family, contains REC and winged-helix (WHTH) domain n=1 Tax=Amycolatopsis tolypomycina TaxID=208445 RepID=A0A1H4IJQ8_9PSEU|nr:DNA-binding response regulator, OmpR family, contains REC and winged-helix (wHTH) domain [Amycolatopsis tolypomycina]